MLRPAASIPLTAVALAAVLAAAAPARGQDAVRVRVLGAHAPASVTVTAEGAPADLYVGGFDNPVGRLAAGERATLAREDAEVAVGWAQGALRGLSIRLVPTGDGRIVLDVQDGRPLGAPRRYAGPLAADVEGDALRLVNTVPLETYVAAVLPHEYGFDDVEGSRAMAVVVRTYALRAKDGTGGAYDHTDDVGSQVYRGIDGVTDVARRAAESTRGQVLTYGGAPADAVYYSASGGHTADNDAVWDGAPVPYLRGKPDPYDASPHDAWESRVERPALLAALTREAGADVTGFYLADRSRDGRVTTIDLRLADGGRRPMSGNAFRLLVTRTFGAHALKSTLFDARRAGDAYVFTGRGYGHGVGMSQWGAHRMAERGMSYRDILGFYYTGTALHTLDGRLVAELTAGPAAAPPRAARTDTLPPPSADGRRIGW